MKNMLPVMASSLLLMTAAAATMSAHAADLSTLYANAEHAGLHYQPLHEALNGYAWARGQGRVHNQNVLTVIDYTLPSTQKRLWVIDLRTGKVLTQALVAHGHNSGYIYASHFSNKVNSHETSLGVFTTGRGYYYGIEGQSLKIYGLEKGINSNAYKRAIEMHPSQYVQPSYIRDYGRIGRTYGCFGLNPAKAHRIESEVVGGSVIFAYASPENGDPVVA